MSDTVKVISRDLLGSFDGDRGKVFGYKYGLSDGTVGASYDGEDYTLDIGDDCTYERVGQYDKGKASGLPKLRLRKAGGSSGGGGGGYSKPSGSNTSSGREDHNVGARYGMCFNAVWNSAIQKGTNAEDLVDSDLFWATARRLYNRVEKEVKAVSSKTPEHMESSGPVPAEHKARDASDTFGDEEVPF